MWKKGLTFLKKKKKKKASKMPVHVDYTAGSVHTG